MTIASPRKGRPSLKIGTSILAIHSCVSGPLKRSVITIERVENARRWAAIAIGLRRGRACPGWANGVQELLAICISDQYPGPYPGRERAARLGLERVKIVVEQRR